VPSLFIRSRRGAHLPPSAQLRGGQDIAFKWRGNVDSRPMSKSGRAASSAAAYLPSAISRRRYARTAVMSLFAAGPPTLLSSLQHEFRSIRA